MNENSIEIDRQQRHDAVKKWLWMSCIWCWPIGVVGFFIGFALIAGFVPPPSPAWSAQELAAFFAGDLTRIRFGILIALFASSLLLPFYAVISAEIKKIEGKPSLLAPIQFGGAVILVAFFQIISLAWITASFRQDVSPEITRMLNDYCWFVWSTLIPTYSLQYVCMAIAGFMDKRAQPLWPRWASYMNLWIAITGAGGGLAVFFKKGPFAWDGLIGFWIPVLVFAIGMCVTTGLLLRRYKLDEAQPAGRSVRSGAESFRPA
ncbi:MAG: hypothetical protein JWQ90_2105 [Hydrocarboniphaga sp.]|uniref:hypothetical protein n=1 Tax=Hydrocarboniphaga sp. TaxID=2033016 RepID=UPI002628EF94|nr:hypothetical protein [Hydrocarboniphaga sp.]MDB5969655.1 hypothetical protein [Hydrocarboniphaga sp.]